MVDILHRVGIKSSVDEVYEALATREGLAAWWTNNTQGESKVGGALRFRFSAGGSARSATRFNAPRGSPAASARPAAVISESIAIAPHL